MSATIAAIILGAIQGMTEFLPVSSSGHLVLAQHFLGVSFPGMTFEVILHFGTLLAVIFFFWTDLKSIISIFIQGSITLLKRGKFTFSPEQKLAWRFGWLIIFGSIPTAALGLLLGSVIEDLFASVTTVGIMLLLTGTLLWWIERTKGLGGKDIMEMGLYDALFIGFAQGCAIMPGLSRSGSTITGALLRGLDRNTAMRFSFLLSLPAIIGATILQLKDIASATAEGQVTLGDYGIGFVVAFISGMVAIKLLYLVVKQRRLHYFGYYCWLTGIITLTINLLG